MAESVTVSVCYKGSVQAFVIHQQTTFADLKAQVCDYWQIDPSLVSLQDADECSWVATDIVVSWTDQLPDDLIYVKEVGKQKAPSSAAIQGVPSIVELSLGANPERRTYNSDDHDGFSGSQSFSMDDADYTKRTPKQKGKSNKKQQHTYEEDDNDNDEEEEDEDYEEEEEEEEEEEHQTVDELVNDEKMDVQDELWRIFTLYCVQGSAGVEHMVKQQFFKLLQECSIIKPPSQSGASTKSPQQSQTMTSSSSSESHHHPVSIGRADADIVFVAECGSAKMAFEDFLGALMKIGAKFYQNDPSLNPSKAFFRMLFERVLPLASRWIRDDNEQYLNTDEVCEVFLHFEKFLKQLFCIYSTKNGWMTYDTFCKLCNDFEIGLIGLSSSELAKVFLCSKFPPRKKNWFHQKHRAHLSLPEFVQVLGRIALVGFSKSSTATPSSMVKALFQHMHQSNNFTKHEKKVIRNPKSKVAKILQRSFISMWEHDGRRDYLMDEADLAIAKMGDKMKAEVVVKGLKGHLEEALDVHEQQEAFRAAIAEEKQLDRKKKRRQKKLEKEEKAKSLIQTRRDMEKTKKKTHETSSRRPGGYRHYEDPDDVVSPQEEEEDGEEDHHHHHHHYPHGHQKGPKKTKSNNKKQPKRKALKRLDIDESHELTVQTDAIMDAISTFTHDDEPIVGQPLTPSPRPSMALYREPKVYTPRGGHQKHPLFTSDAIVHQRPSNDDDVDDHDDDGAAGSRRGRHVNVNEDGDDLNEKANTTRNAQHKTRPRAVDYHHESDDDVDVDLETLAVSHKYDPQPHLGGRKAMRDTDQGKGHGHGVVHDDAEDDEDDDVEDGNKPNTRHKTQREKKKKQKKSNDKKKKKKKRDSSDDNTEESEGSTTASSDDHDKHESKPKSKSIKEKKQRKNNSLDIAKEQQDQLQQQLRQQEMEKQIKAEVEAKVKAERDAERTKQDKERRQIQLRASLQQGMVFSKHGRKGSPHDRYVMLSPDGQHICWGKSKDQVSNDIQSRRWERSLDLQDIKYVSMGSGTSVFARLSAEKRKPIKPLAFSLVTPMRSLDLVASSTQVRSDWAEYFQLIVEANREKEMAQFK